MWGWIVAALPALGFLTSVKIVLARTEPRVVTAVASTLPEVTPRWESTDRPHRQGHLAPLPDASSPVATDAPDLSGERLTAEAPGQVRPDDQADPGPNTVSPDRPTGRSAESVDLPPDRSTATLPASVGTTAPRRIASRKNSNPRAATSTAPEQGRLPEELVDAGREVAAHLVQEGKSMSRNALIAELRARGHKIGTDRAGDLLRHLNTRQRRRTPVWSA